MKMRYTQVEMVKRKKLFPTKIKYRKEGPRAILKHDKLFINGQKYKEIW